MQPKSGRMPRRLSSAISSTAKQCLSTAKVALSGSSGLTCSLCWIAFCERDFATHEIDIIRDGVILTPQLVIGVENDERKGGPNHSCMFRKCVKNIFPHSTTSQQFPPGWLLCHSMSLVFKKSPGQAGLERCWKEPRRATEAGGRGSSSFSSEVHLSVLYCWKHFGEHHYASKYIYICIPIDTTITIVPNI